MLRGLGDLGKMGGILKQAMEMKSRIEELKQELAKERFETSVGGGVVRVEVSGTLEVLAVHIDPEIVCAENVHELETLVQSGINSALASVQEKTQSRMRELAGGYDIPGIV